jgi:4'-phosphopantetheinyl transferase
MSAAGSGGDPVRLAADRVDLWLAEVGTPAATARPFEQWLSADERRRADAQLRPEAREQRLVAAAARRVALSAYLACEPQAWRFQANAHGRPDVVPPAAAPGLCVNVAHADGLVAVVVGLVPELGVDVEVVGRRRRILDIAERSFAADEAAALRHAPAEVRPELFARLWTLKESYLKARGVGVWGGVALDACRFELDEDHETPQFRLAPIADDRPAEWRFVAFAPTGRHRGAIAVRTGGVAVGVAAFALTTTLDAFAPLVLERHGPVLHVEGFEPARSP